MSLSSSRDPEETTASLDANVEETNKVETKDDETTKQAATTMSDEPVPPELVPVPPADAKRSAPTEPILTKPLKKGRTAYFIFADVKRAEVQAAHKGEGVAVQARATGQLWAALSTEERAVYQNIAAEEREQFAKEWAILKEKGLLPDADAPASSLVGLVLPVARVRKICKLDPDVRGMSKESLLLVTKSAELFTQCLGTESVRVAQLQNRRKLLPEDVAQVCSSRDPFLFLREDIKDLLREQQQQQQHQQTSSKTSQSTNHSKTTTADHIMAGSRSLTSYFGSTSSGAAATSTTTTD